MEISLAAIADCANVSDLGKMNIMGVFSTIFAAETPASHAQCYLAIVFKLDMSENGQKFQVKVDIRNPDGKPIIEPLVGELIAPDGPGGERQEVNLVIGLTGLTFSQFGDYEVEICVNDIRKQIIAITVRPLVSAVRG